MTKADSYRDLVKFGVENSSTPVSKAVQGSKQHKTDILNYVNKVVADNEPKIEDQKILANNINNRPVAKLTNRVPVYQYPRIGTPKQVGQLAERLEENRQRNGEMSTWDMIKATADTPEQKKEIREIILRDYKKNGAKNMAETDLKWIGKSRVQNAVNEIKIDVKGISDSINNYINAQKLNAPTPPPPKQPDPDLNGGLAAILGAPYEN